MWGASGCHRHSLWLAGQCGWRDEGRGVRFLWYGAGHGGFPGWEGGRGASQGQHSWLVEGKAREELFSSTIKLSINGCTFALRE